MLLLHVAVEENLPRGISGCPAAVNLFISRTVSTKRKLKMARHCLLDIVCTRSKDIFLPKMILLGNSTALPCLAGQTWLLGCCLLLLPCLPARWQIIQRASISLLTLYVRHCDMSRSNKRRSTNCDLPSVCVCGIH